MPLMPQSVYDYTLYVLLSRTVMFALFSLTPIFRASPYTHVKLRSHQGTPYHIEEYSYYRTSQRMLHF